MQHQFKFNSAIVWLRRDLRLDDNPALVAAMQQARNVVPVFIWAPDDEWQFQPGKLSRWWLKQSLMSLDHQIRQAGSKVVYRSGKQLKDMLVQLVRELKVDALFFNHLYDPISLVRDHEIKLALQSMNVRVQSYNAELLYEPWEIVSNDGQAFVEFDKFWTCAMTKHYQPPMPLPPPVVMAAPVISIDAGQFSDLELLTEEEEASTDYLKYLWQPGYQGASMALAAFLQKGLPLFSRDRAKTDRDSTSKLSPYLHYGEMSIRTVYYKVRELQIVGASIGRAVCKESCEDFLRQVGYREYSRYLSFHFPFTHDRALLEHLRACPWRMDQAGFKLWQQGLTGYPLVDAGMRSLWSTGWLHNRLRVLVAQFLVKHLLLPWQWGLKHFWDTLLDADLESDALGWQYVAGCMIDAPQFNTMRDLEKEAKRFDPDGHFVRQWLPQLVRLPAQFIHSPWKAPTSVLRQAGVELGITYPHPIVTLEESQEYVRKASAVIAQNLQPRGEAQPFRERSVLPSKPLNLSVDDTEINQAVDGAKLIGKPTKQEDQEVSSKKSTASKGESGGTGTGTNLKLVASGPRSSNSTGDQRSVDPKLSQPIGTDTTPSSVAKEVEQTTRPTAKRARDEKEDMMGDNTNINDNGDLQDAHDTDNGDDDVHQAKRAKKTNSGPGSGFDPMGNAELGQFVWRQQLESEVSGVQAPKEGHVLDKLLKGAPTGEMEAQWQVIKHAIVKVAQTSLPGVRLEGGTLKHLVHSTLANVQGALGTGVKLVDHEKDTMQGTSTFL